MDKKQLKKKVKKLKTRLKNQKKVQEQVAHSHGLIATWMRGYTNRVNSDGKEQLLEAIMDELEKVRKLTSDWRAKDAASFEQPEPESA